jgi:crotonobetaine/carnitine-CoA ligase
LNVIFHSFLGQDIAVLLETRGMRHGGNMFLGWVPFEGEGATWTYGAFLEEVRSIAGGLAARGVKPGNRILLHAENCPEALLTWFAATWMGAVCVSSNPKATGPELRYFASHTGAVGAVTQPAFANLLSDHCPELKWIAVTTTDGVDRPDRESSFEALRGEPMARCALDAVTASNILFTSGTTSRPKAVVWTRANVL